MKKETFENEKGHNVGLPPLQLVIEAKGYSWSKQYITGVELKQLAGIPLDTDLYLSVQKPYSDELIENEKQVNLARPEIEHFFVKKKLQFFINHQPFTWYKQYIKGSEIRELGNIPPEHEIFLDIKEGWQDDPITDDEVVDLARPGKERFYSKEKQTEVTIIINGTPHKWDKKQISFVEIIVLAYNGYVDKPTMVYTVAYEDGPKENPEGSMIKGQNVVVKNKMIFHATATDKS
ncbi:multiubiquitin domain-containing protein [Niabella drilacis]|uniref:Multiubiquitin n=1 Tax=Niabella drilacis (strain DSM 25811 / CCM 8410 / CCUG 62505 / LMG 26954 / E90) TaxID=1285928 RepID=A0A1G6XHE8_NIADE|nr:multiubiquitin domain-containing protein [Niabella drilacis]SDD77482.1 Multiubiquitin [Niabella drilacis]